MLPDVLGAYFGRRVMITGASGFIGRWVGRALTAAGADLWLVGRDTKALESVCDEYEVRGRTLITDLSQLGVFTRLYQEVRPHVTFNVAGYGVDPGERDPALAEALNERLVAEVAEVISGDSQSAWHGLRLIHIGSGFEYGSVDGSFTEDTPAVPVSSYGKTKLAGTQHLMATRQRAGLRATTARLFTVYGPGEHAGRLLPSLLRLARTGGTLPLTAGEQKRDFTYVEDVAEGLLRLGLVKQAPGVVNLATGQLTAVREFAECAAELLSLSEGQLQFGALPYRADELRQGAVDTSLLEKVVGWRPSCPVREGLRRTIAFDARLSAGACERMIP